MFRRLGSKLTYANVAASLALILSLSTGVAYAAHEHIFSSDIVNGEVKRPDLAAGAVVTAKVGDGAITAEKLAPGSVTGAKVADDTIGGDDVVESTLNGVNASELNGHKASDIASVSGAVRTSDEILPDCSPGTDYMALSFTAPSAGFALVNGSISFRTANGTGEAFAARIERTAPTLEVSGFQEEVQSQAGRSNIALTQVFAVSAGVNTFVVKACDSSDVMGIDTGTAIEGQLTAVFTPFTA
jgi:hypothetical protein